MRAFQENMTDKQLNFAIGKEYIRKRKATMCTVTEAISISPSSVPVDDWMPTQWAARWSTAHLHAVSKSGTSSQKDIHMKGALPKTK